MFIRFPAILLVETIDSYLHEYCALTEEKLDSLNSLYLDVSDFFKDGSSKLNNHSAMTVGKFILALSVQFEFCFILRQFSLRFCMKMI